MISSHITGFEYFKNYHPLERTRKHAQNEHTHEQRDKYTYGQN